MKLKGSMICGVIGVGLLVGAYATSWYRLDSNSLIKTTTTFFWQKVTVKAGDSTKSAKYDDAGLDHIKDTFASVLTFMTIGTAVLLASVVLNALRVWLKFGKGSRIMKYIAIIIAVAAVVLLGIAWTTFFNITKAFKDDTWPSCYDISSTSAQYNCKSLMGKHNYSSSRDYKWRPDIGWFLCIAGFVFAGISMGAVLSSRRK